MDALSKVVNAVGRPLHTNNFTAAAERISYVKILIEVNGSQPLPDMIVIETLSMIGSLSTVMHIEIWS